MNPDERPSKRDAFLAFYGEGWVSVHLDARREGVKVPPEFSGNGHLVLQYGRDMPVAIPDLAVDDEGIRATLSFSRTPHATFIPWSAIYIVACTDGRGILYYEDVPEDVPVMARPAVDPETGEPIDATAEPAAGEDDDDVTALPLAAGAERKSAEVAPLRRERILKSVPAENAAETADDEPAPIDPPRRRKRPQLKLVK